MQFLEGRRSTSVCTIRATRTISSKQIKHEGSTTSNALRVTRRVPEWTG